MGGNNVPSLESLEKPEKFQDVLRRDRGDDCLGCKIVGKSFASQLNEPIRAK